jgi:hypothetical protein
MPCANGSKEMEQGDRSSIAPAQAEKTSAGDESHCGDGDVKGVRARRVAQRLAAGYSGGMQIITLTGSWVEGPHKDCEGELYLTVIDGEVHEVTDCNEVIDDAVHSTGGVLALADHLADQFPKFVLARSVQIQKSAQLNTSLARLVRGIGLIRP